MNLLVRRGQHEVVGVDHVLDVDNTIDLGESRPCERIPFGKALAALAARQLGALSAAEERLLKLMLSLAEMGPAVEWYGTGEFPDGFDGRRFKLIEQMPDNEPQGVAA